MPPAPISRSSTYLPKIWGNMVLAVLGPAAFGCGPEPAELVTRTVRVYSLPGCPAPEGAPLELEALGAFPATNLTAELLPIGAAGRTLRFPHETRAIVAAAGGEDNRFVGYGEAPSGDVELVLWPEGEACTVFDRAALAGFPSTGGGQALGFAPGLGLLLAAGGNDPTSSAVVGALTFDVRRGTAHAVDASARHVLGEPRAFASVTEFGAGLLVAGGENPIHDVPEETRVLRDTAEVYDPAAQRFELELLELRERRTRHAALLLPSGETLLIGGRGEFGSALATLEVVTPATRSSSLGVDPLAVGRIEPAALRLSDGRLFVGGGYAADGRPVTALEWLEPDGDGSLLVLDPPDLPARFDRAFVAMPGGALLAVGGCADRATTSAEDAAACAAACRRGCPPESGEGFWIAADGSVEPVEVPVVAPRPLLLTGSDGSPWLFAGDQALRFNPFRARFEVARSAPEVRPPSLLAAPLAVAADHFFWISGDDPPALVGLRASTRGAFARDVGLIATTQPFDPSWPRHLAPDRRPGEELDFDGSLRFAGGSPLRVFVTDALYEDVEIRIIFEGAPPLLVLGQTELGGEDCAWPDDDASLIVVRRRGAAVEVDRGQARVDCSVPSGPAELAVGSPGAPSRVVGLELERL